MENECQYCGDLVFELEEYGGQITTISSHMYTVVGNEVVDNYTGEGVTNNEDRKCIYHAHVYFTNSQPKLFTNIFNFQKAKNQLIYLLIYLFGSTGRSISTRVILKFLQTSLFRKLQRNFSKN